MKITGIAPGISSLYEKNCPPSDELAYLASQALQTYHPSTLITSLYPGWDQALAKAALSMDIPIHVALPYRKRESFIRINSPDLYKDLLPKAKYIECLADTYHEGVDLQCHLWRADRADLVLALWDYEFCGETFQVVDHALKSGKRVITLWEDWSRLYGLRKDLEAIYHAAQSRGALIFPKKP